jgi:hypothetical protein
MGSPVPAVSTGVSWYAGANGVNRVGGVAQSFECVGAALVFFGPRRLADQAGARIDRQPDVSGAPSAARQSVAVFSGWKQVRRRVVLIPAFRRGGRLPAT